MKKLDEMKRLKLLKIEEKRFLFDVLWVGMRDCGSSFFERF